MSIFHMIFVYGMSEFSRKIKIHYLSAFFTFKLDFQIFKLNFQIFKVNFKIFKLS